MKGHRLDPIIVAVLLLAGLEASGNELSGLRAPSAPDTPWAVPNLHSFSSALREERPAQIDPRKEYELSELIDLAECANPETKAVWHRAREAASALGLAQSEYFPLLALKATAEWGRVQAPVPLTLNKSAYMDVEAQQARPVAELEWVLLDFGRRAATVEGARQRLLASNLGFNARHLDVVFRVQTAFYKLTTARGRITVAQASLDSATKVQEAADERLKQGLATAPDVSQARQQAVQAAFEIEEASLKERDAQVTLAESIGVLPTEPIQVADFSRLPLPTHLEDSVEKFIDRSLEQRPDLLAKVALLRQKEADIKRQRSAYLPTVSLLGEAGGAFDRAQIKLEGSRAPWTSSQEPTWGVGLVLKWTLFDAGARARKMEMAREERDAARHELEDSRDKAISQVWQFYTNTKLAIRRLEVADALVEASDKSYQQTFEAYEHGLSSLVDLLQARRELSRARYTQLDTRATLLESAAALAYASGDLGPQLLNRKKGNRIHP